MADDATGNRSSNMGGARQSGVISDKQQQGRDSAIESMKRAWNVDTFEAIFPTSIKPEKMLGISAISNLRAISSKVQNLAAAQALFLNECKSKDGRPIPITFSHTERIWKALRGTELNNGGGRPSTSTPKAKAPAKTKTLAQKKTSAQVETPAERKSPALTETPALTKTPAQMGPSAATGMDPQLDSTVCTTFKIPKKSRALPTGVNVLDSSANIAPTPASDSSVTENTKNGGRAKEKNNKENQKHSANADQTDQTKNDTPVPTKKRENPSKQFGDDGQTPQAKKQKTGKEREPLSGGINQTKKAQNAGKVKSLGSDSDSDSVKAKVGKEVKSNNTGLQQEENIRAAGKDSQQAKHNEKHATNGHTHSEALNHGGETSELGKGNGQTTSVAKGTPQLGGADNVLSAVAAESQKTPPAADEGNEDSFAFLAQQIADQKIRNEKLFASLNKPTDPIGAANKQEPLAENGGNIVIEAGNQEEADGGDSPSRDSSTTLADAEDSQVAPVAQMSSVQQSTGDAQPVSAEAPKASAAPQRDALTRLCEGFLGLSTEFLVSENLLGSVALGSEQAVMGDLDLVLSNTVRHLRSDIEWVLIKHRSQGNGGNGGT